MKRPRKATYILLQPGMNLYHMWQGKDLVSKVTTAQLAKIDNSEWEWEDGRLAPGRIPLNSVSGAYNPEIDEADIQLVDMPTLSKDKRAIMVKDSEWIVDEDMPAFIGIPTGSYQSNREDRVIPKGTKLTVLNPKSETDIDLMEEKCIRVKMDGIEYKLPVRFIGGCTCTKQGKAKTYWKLLDKHGKPVRTKRYGNLGNVKSSVRIITGIVPGAYDETTGEETGPWWLDGAAAAPGFTAGDSDLEKFDNWIAVEYAAVGNKELQRVQLKDWLMVHKLKGKK